MRGGGGVYLHLPLYFISAKDAGQLRASMDIVMGERPEEGIVCIKM